MYKCLILRKYYVKYHELKYQCIVIDNQQQIRFINRYTKTGLDTRKKESLVNSVLCVFPIWIGNRIMKVQNSTMQIRMDAKCISNFKYK